MQAGGFAAIVLDLCRHRTRRHARRDPLASWFRFRQAADSSRCCLIVLGKASYAQSSTALVLECAPAHAQTVGWNTTPVGFSLFAARARSFGHLSLRVHADHRPPQWSAGLPHGNRTGAHERRNSTHVCTSASFRTGIAASEAGLEGKVGRRTAR